jgi:hypothetical protein
MIKKFGALAAVGALTAVLVTGCGGDSGGYPKPGAADPKEWCFADQWIDRASYDYGYWAAGNIPGPDEARRAMSYGSRLMSQYQQDKQSGDLPADLDDKALTAWVVNLATVQERAPLSTEDAGSGRNVMDSYIEQVHSACN